MAISQVYKRQLLGGLFWVIIVVACVPSNDLMPLRGEDPEALALSSERAEWLSVTGATRSFDRFRKALRLGNYDEVIYWLGPVTRSIVQRRAQALGMTERDLLASNALEELSLPGTKNPLRDLKNLPQGAGVREEGDFDPTKRRVTLAITRPGFAGSISVPVVYEQDGWKVELVWIEPATPAPVPVPEKGGENHDSVAVPGKALLRR